MSICILIVYNCVGQNEPENSNPTYPTCSMPVAVEAQIGTALRTLMNNNGFSSTKLIGYEHNWDDAAGYPVQLVALIFRLCNYILTPFGLDATSRKCI